MKPTVLLGAALSTALALGVQLGVQTVRADEIDPEVKRVVDKGLAYVAKTQNPDGHWDANAQQAPVTMTALGGMVMLMEGSTVRDGKYSDKIRKAADWLMARSQPNGMIGDPRNPTEATRYMYGHGFSLLFLSQIYGEEDDADRRKKLEGILTAAVQFCGKSQSTQGGWYYMSAKECNDADEGSVTITQVQALRAARNAGIVVPKEIIDKAVDYLKKSTTERGGVVYSLGRGGRGAMAGGERPALTAAAISCGFAAGEYNNALVKKWFTYCKEAIPLDGGGRRMGHDEYTHYYFAQSMYMLGEDGWEKMFGATPEDKRMSWSKYRKNKFSELLRSQAGDGSWGGGGGYGAMFSTTVNLTILQLEGGVLPIYQR